MAYNEGIDFDTAPQSVREAFLRRAEKVLLKHRTKIYRWANHAPNPGASPHVLPAWWAFVESTRLPSGFHAEGFAVTEERARRLGRTHRDLARARLAISGGFSNAMKALIVGELLIDTWALAGQASGQPEFEKALDDLQNVYFIGGAVQLWIPGLTMHKDLQLVPTMA